MGKLYDKLASDVRLEEGPVPCINCGTCTAVCPAAEFYKYDPKRIVTSSRHRTMTRYANYSKAMLYGTVVNVCHALHDALVRTLLDW